MQEKVDTLLEQITFLGEKQKDLYANSISSFDDLLSEIEGKLKTAGQGEQDLKWVFDHISEYKKDSTQDIQDDIKFLEEQVTALDQIRSMQDSAKAEELLNMIIDPKEELLSTKEFKERVEITYKGKTIIFKMIDTPGIATRIDYEKFLKYKIKKKEAKKRAKEATQGVIESIKWLDDMDLVVIVLDSTENPYNQVNITIIGNLVARKIPVLIVANKVDLRKSDIKKIEAAFPEYEIVGISAKYGKNLEEFYESIFKLSKKIK